MRYSCSSSSLANVALVFGLVLALGHVVESFLPDPNELLFPGLKVGFYNGRCPNNATLDIQAFIEAEVENKFWSDNTLLPAFLRLQFHDCFVRGCDASILIAGASTERVAAANAGVRDFDFIDALKVKVEAICPNTVSCADIIAIATKVVLKLGGGPNYAVLTGRRDGTRSNVDDVKLPSPSLNVSQSFEFFKAKGFSLEEMVTLLGCHTVGIAHCVNFQNRLYNDNVEYDADMDPKLRRKLMQTCPPSKTSTDVAFLDQSEEYPKMFTIDVSFYNQILYKRGVLSIDQAIARDPSTLGNVTSFVNDPSLFNDKLAQVMVKLQAVEVFTGLQGNIRKVCSKFN